MAPTFPIASDASRAAASGPRLRVRVKGVGGRTELIELAATSETEAIRKASVRGLQVLAVESDGLADARPAAARRPFPLLLFSQELLALLEAGLNLTEALATLQAKERQPQVAAVLDAVLRALREGRSFSDVLASMPGHFPQVYVATVRASERTGDLPQVLTRFVAYQQQFDSLRKKLMSAAIYPVMLLVVGGFVTLFLLGYVVPRFALVYESSGREMPWLSAAMLAFGQLIAAHWQLATAAFVASMLLAAWAASRAAGRAWVLEQFLRLPWISTRADAFRLARFYRAVSLLLAAGIALPRAMGMVPGLLGPRQQGRLAQGRLAVEQGSSLSSAFVAAGLASPVAESLIKVGERSGQMAEMLERTARFADEDFARWVDWASRLLEPVLMLFIGLVIGTVVVLMYVPIFELAGSLQ